MKKSYYCPNEEGCLSKYQYIWKKLCNMIKLSGFIIIFIFCQQNILAQKQRFIFEGVQRTYEVHVPQVTQPKMPLVFVFH